MTGSKLTGLGGSGNSSNGSPKLPEAPQGWFKSATDRLFISLNRKKPGPKNLADRKFIKTIKKSGEKTTSQLKDAKIQLQDWKSAQSRYEEIVAYVTDLTEQQGASLDDILQKQEAIATFQTQLEELINSAQDADENALAKLNKIKAQVQELRDNQKTLEKQLQNPGAPKKSDDDVDEEQENK